MNLITFYLEDNDNEEFTLNGETLPFILQIFKIWNNKGAFKYLKVILIALVVDIDLVEITFMVK